MIGFLYGQTEYNMLKSSLRLDEYIKKANSYGYNCLSITDHNLHAHYQFYTKCLANNIKPIIGLEINVESSDAFPNVMICYALDNNGYEGLIKLSSLDKISDKVYTLQELRNYTGLCFITTSNSDIYRMAKSSEFNQIIDRVNEYENNLYSFGVGISLEKREYLQYARKLYDLIRNEEISVYPLSQTLYDLKEDACVYEALSLIDNRNIKIDGDYHYKDSNELQEEFFMFEDCFKCYEALVNEINVAIKPVLVSLPKYPKTDGLSSKDFLENLCYKGLNRRFLLQKNNRQDIYEQRLKYELSVIHKMKYDDYFLIVWDYVKYAKKEGIMVGPGRGSAAGSLVAYCLGITNVDPLKYDLLFERFLNPERVSMPDIDVDFPDDKRDFVISYVRDLYGKERVCTICAFGTFQIKSSIRDLGRVLKINPNDIDVIAKLASIARNSQTQEYENLLNQYANNQEIYNLLSIAKKIENLPRHISTHAAGIVLSNDNLTRNVPIQLGPNGLFQSQLEASDLASLGLLKMDFLGIRNLSIIDNICKCIPNMNNITINNIMLNDMKTYNMLQQGDTLGIFQLESEGIKKVLVKLKPTQFNDLVAVLALYRPGPMDNIDEFILRKHGKPFKYYHKDLEDILKPTYGIIVYQEQIMQIAYRFAKMSLGEADILRRAVSKKNRDILKEYRNKFVNGAIKNGYDNVVANQIYDYIVKFADYGFNKSHSVAYALISYQMAYFKANYFSLFMAKLLNNVIGNTATIISYIDYAKRHGVNILKPDINVSSLEFVSSNNSLIFPLNGIYSIGLNVSKEIIEERNKNGLFKDFNDFRKRLPGINKNIYEALIYSGAFDVFNNTKQSMLEKIDSSANYEEVYPDEEKLDYKVEELSFDVLKQYEKKYLGLNIVYDSFKNIDILHKNFNSFYLLKRFVNNEIRTIVEFVYLKEIITKNNKPMLVGSIFDGKTEIGFVMFNNVYEKEKNKISLNKLYVTSGKLVFNDQKAKYELQVNSIIKQIN